MTEPAAGAVRDDRRLFRRCRRRVLAASGTTVVALAGLAALFVAPNRLASLRLGDLALAWWVAGAVVLIGLVTLSRGFREIGALTAPGGTSRLTPLALAAVWSSPALWLGLPPLLLADGTRGLWAPVVVIGGTVVALLVLGTAWSRTGGLMVPASVLAQSRWPGAHGCHALLGSIETIVAGLFVWAQLAAVREIGAMAGWPRATTIGITLLIIGALLLSELARFRLTALGGGLALAGLAVPLVVIALGTTTAWPQVWSAVASRPRIGFGEASRWTVDGGAVLGPATTLTLTFADEQRVTFAARGSVIVEPREGGRLARDVEPGEEVALHAGDRLVVPAGLRLRFEAGRRVPDAPDSGPEWLEPPSRAVGGLWLMALGVTGFLGALGLPTGTTPVGAGRLSPGRGARLAAILVTAGVALAVGWSLYAAWLTPEVYVGGVTGAEVYALPESMPGPRGSGYLLTWFLFGGLAVGGAAAALGGLRGRQVAAGWPRRLAVVLVASAGTLVGLVPVGAWTLLLATLGLAASALAPAAVLACWSERATARSASGGTGAGLLVFLLLALGGAATQGSLGEGWGSVASAAPAAVAAPVHLLVAWFLRSRGMSSARSPLPPGLEGLSTGLPARSRAS
ncbi:MAG TPA: hypothetical protein VLL75_09740 [Vicinamibacteria bacterium]|nr:hypothetical protein [Vicinamibacteria bacterium]